MQLYSYTKLTRKTDTNLKSSDTCDYCGKQFGNKRVARVKRGDEVVAWTHVMDCVHNEIADREAADKAKAMTLEHLEKKRLEKERDARKAARGTFEEFTVPQLRSKKLDADEKIVYRVMVGVTNSDSKLAKAKERFLEKFEVDPRDAVRWSSDLVSAVAAQSVNIYLRNAFAAGLSRQEMEDEAVVFLTRAATDDGISTNPMSNLVERSEVAVWASVVEALRGGWARW